MRGLLAISWPCEVDPIAGVAFGLDMSMSPPFQTLADMSDEDLRAAYDRLAPSTVVGQQFYLDELRRRDAARQQTEMLRLTRLMAALTVAVTVLTVINVVLVAIVA